MDFPAYVPETVQTHIATLIEGTADDPNGWEAALFSAQKQIAETEDIEAYARGDKPEHPTASQHTADARSLCDMLTSSIACLRRLACDLRMREAYALLAREFADHGQWRGFISAAWGAQMDFGIYRDRLKRAVELRDQIATTSEALASLLRDTSEIPLSHWPSEFYSIPELLRKTDNHELQGHNLRMWRAMRPYVLGDSPGHASRENEQSPQEEEQSNTPGIAIGRATLEPGETPQIDALAQTQENLLYGWQVSPDVSALLDTLALAARNFSPSEYGTVGTAVRTRQRSAKTEYLRAFGDLLMRVHHLTPTPTIRRAMAIVATVVINLPDVVVSDDDVRKAMPSLGRERPLEGA